MSCLFCLQHIPCTQARTTIATLVKRTAQVYYASRTSPPGQDSTGKLQRLTSCKVSSLTWRSLDTVADSSERACRFAATPSDFSSLRCRQATCACKSVTLSSACSSLCCNASCFFCACEAEMGCYKASTEHIRDSLCLHASCAIQSTHFH